MQQNYNILNDILVQKDYVNNPIIKTAFEYFKQLPINDKKLISDYKSEMDSDDWNDKPLEISYTVINWILQQKSRTLLYMPELLESGSLTKEQFIHQIFSAKKLINILSYFPKISGNNSFNLYRGDTNELGNFIIKNNKNNQISLFSFLSTSLNLSVASNFSRGCLLCINIPSGFPIPYISDKLTLNYSSNIDIQDTSESEVLLPLGCTFKLFGIYNNIQVNGKLVNLFYLQLVSFGPHNTRNFWNNYVKMAEDLYNKIPKENNNEQTIEIEGGNKKKIRKSKKYRKIKKGKNIKKYNKSRKN
jgi:hypothetical protein